jgi:Domain of unknown function (DUF2017)
VRKFKRRGNLVTTHLSAYEVSLLSSLVHQLVEMVSEGEPAAPATTPESADPFELWAREMAEAAPIDEPQDPVLRRLFPDAYPGDDSASADFRRFTERDLRAKKVVDARKVLARLAETREGQFEMRIPRDEVEIWLRTLTSLRLAVGIRLGITDASTADELARLPEDDPRTFMVSIYDWLGFAQETLISAL